MWGLEIRPRRTNHEARRDAPLEIERVELAVLDQPGGIRDHGLVVQRPELAAGADPRRERENQVRLGGLTAQSRSTDERDGQQ